MYETYFQLSSRPFTAAGRADNYIPNATCEPALKNLTRAIERGAGPGLIIGATGTGKSFLLQLLAARYADAFRVALLATARFSSPRALLQNVLYELGRPYKGMDEEELRLALNEHLTENESDDRPLLLLVDEAHTLSLRLLEEIRLITNLSRNGQPLVQLVLAGNARLEERFTNPKLDSLNQRIAARCYLESMNREDTTYYVKQQITRAGGKADRLLADDAFGAIYTATDGVPRLVNQVCDQALILAAINGAKSLNAALIEEAWADLQQLPTPWNHESPAARSASEPAAGVVEFGSLGDDEASSSPQEVAADEPELPVSAMQTQPMGDGLFSYDTSLAAEQTMQLEDIEREVTELGNDVRSAVTQPLPEFVTEPPADDDFQPAGFVGPEVELVFHGAHHPFGESFDEEEVVIDRYASLEKSLPQPLVHDQSGEGRQIAAELQQSQSKAASQTLPLSVIADDEATENDYPSVDGERVFEEQPETDLAAITTDWEAAADEPITPAGADTEIDLAADAPAEELIDDHGDRDIIIIEEQRREATAVAAKPRTRARRQEYRQLFARLRKGG